jgi:hypothetical protein
MFKLSSSGIALLALFGLVVAPAAANAADTLYATPNPAPGAACVAESPCSLEKALGDAAGGDTVVIGAGTYESPGGSFEDGGKSLTISGAVIGPGRPVIADPFVLRGPGTRLSDVQVESSEFLQEALDLGGGASADRVLAVATEADGCSIHANGGGAITNSLCLSKKEGQFSGLATQLSGAGTMAATNVTMIGNHGFFSNSPNNPGLTMTDSIAMTTETGGADATFNQGLTKTIRSYLLHHASTPNVSETESLTQEPVFIGAGDYREAPGSPSIDAGSASAAPGELDLDGNLRKIGPKTDIGAYEFVPDAPTVSTPSVSSITATDAVIDATINPNSGRTYYHLEYGPSSAYGSSTPVVTLPAATAASPVEFDLSNLSPGSTLHFSVVATSDGGTTRTPDATPATPSAQPSTPASSATPPPATPRPSPAKLAPKLTFKGSKGGRPEGQPLLDRSTIKLSTGCGPVACNMTVSAKVKVGAKLLGTLPGPKTPSHWQPGKQGAMKLRIPPKLQGLVREYLQGHPGAKAKILVTATLVTDDGEKATQRLTIAVRPI